MDFNEELGGTFAMDVALEDRLAAASQTSKEEDPGNTGNTPRVRTGLAQPRRIL